MGLFKKKKQANINEISNLNLAAVCDALLDSLSEKNNQYNEMKDKMSNEIEAYKCQIKNLEYRLKALEIADFSRSNSINKYVSQIQYLEKLLRDNNISYIGE